MILRPVPLLSFDCLVHLFICFFIYLFEVQMSGAGTPSSKQQETVAQNSSSDRQREALRPLCVCVPSVLTCGAERDAFLWKIGLTGENLSAVGHELNR